MSERKQAKELETSCIFGKEIHKQCPVRIELGKRAKVDLSKWIKPKSHVFGEAEELLDRFNQALNYEYSTLASFCAVCPFLSLYIENQAKQNGDDKR
jgi:hypothetical protein